MYPVTPWNKGFRFGQLYPKTPWFGDLGGQPHKGLDIIISTGKPVIAHCGGSTEQIPDSSSRTGGNTVLFKTKGFTYWYFHLSKFGKTGQVKKGDIIGYTGNTGKSTNPHLHIGASHTGKIETTMSKLLDPDKLFYDPIKVCVLSKPCNFDLVVDDLAAYGIHIEVTHHDIRPTLTWKNGLIDIPAFMFNHGSLGNGHDIMVAFTDEWEAPYGQYQGYTDDTKVGTVENLFGFEYIFINEKGEVHDPNRTFQYDDPRLESFAHELFHAFKKMAGREFNDSVHNLDNRGALLKEHGIDFTKIYTRNKDNRYRLYKRTNTEIIERIVTKEQVGMFKSGLLYWRLFGFKPNL